MEDEIFEGRYLYLICISKTIKICPNRLTNIFKCLSSRESLKSFQATFFIEFFDKRFSFVILHVLTEIYQVIQDFSSYSVKCVSCSMLRHLKTSWHLNTWKVKIWLSREQKELWKWNKKHFFFFHKRSLLEM